jgi:hypothetical protein
LDEHLNIVFVASNSEVAVALPDGMSIILVEFAKVFAHRVPHAVSSQCARRQDAPILFVGIYLLDLALHSNAPYSSGALHL